MPLCSSAISLAPSFSLSRARGETRRPSLSFSFFSSSWMKNCGHGKTGIPSFREEGRKTKFYSLSPRQCLFETDTFRLGRLPTANFVSSLKRERERIESFEQGRLIIKKMFIYIFSSLILLKEIRIFFENKFFPGKIQETIYIRYIYNLDSGTAFQLTVVGRGITLHGKRKALKAI